MSMNKISLVFIESNLFWVNHIQVEQLIQHLKSSAITVYNTYLT